MKRNTQIVLAITITCSIVIPSIVFLATADGELVIKASLDEFGEYDTIWDTYSDCLDHFDAVSDEWNEYYHDYCIAGMNYNICVQEVLELTIDQGRKDIETISMTTNILQNVCKANLDIELAILNQLPR